MNVPVPRVLSGFSYIVHGKAGILDSMFQDTQVLEKQDLIH